MFYRFILILMIFFIANLQAKENVSLQLLWKHQFEFAGFYMAKEKGFYDDAGIRLNIKEFEFGQDIVDDVEKGKTTFGISYPNIIIEKSNGAEIVVLNALLQSSPHVFVSLKSSQIKSLKDFKNKKVMIDNNAIKNVPLVSMLYSKKISLDEIQIVKPSFSLDDLIKGNTDVSSIYISNELYKLDKQNIKYDIWNPKDYGFDFYNDMLFTSSFTAKTNPTLVNNFQKASLKGWEYAFENIDETIEVILQKYNSQNKTKEALLYEAKMLKELSYVDNIPFGDINKNKIKGIYNIYNLVGLIENKIDLKEFIYVNDKNKLYLTKEEEEYISNNRIITVHNEKNWPPYNFNENNKAKGFSIDYMNLISSKLGITPKYISGFTWNEYVNMIKNEKLDVILNIRKLSNREKFINFTSGYIKASKYIFTNNKRLKTLSDLEDKIVAVPRGFFIHKFLEKNYPKIKLDIQDNVYDCIVEVIGNRADAIIADFMVVQYLLDKKGLNLKYISIIADNKLSEDIHIGTNINNIILRNIIEKAKNNITPQELNEIKSKWFNKSKIQNNNIEFTKTQKDYLANKKSITMCIDPAWMPFEEFDNGRHIGITADYFKIFKNNLGIDINVVKTKSWIESLNYAKQRKCDILSLAAKTDKREKYLNFTSPYLNIPLVIATKMDISFVDNISSLKGKKIAMPKGYAFVERLEKKYPYLNIVKVENIEEGLEKVNNKEVFGYLGTLISTWYQIQNGYLGELKITGKFDEKWDLGVAVRNDDNILLSIFEKLVNNVDNGQRQQILNSWISVKYEQGNDYTLLFQILFIFLIAIIFFLYRQHLLNKANQTLEARVSEQTKELKRINENLEEKVQEELNKVKNIEDQLFETKKLAAMGEMIGNIAHQWRQPLSVISTSATGIIMQKEYNLLDDEKLEKVMMSINDSAQFLSKTIDDFTSVLKGDAKIETFNLSENIEKCFAIENPMLKLNGITLVENYDDSIVLESYPNALIQSMINIINNAKDVLIEKKLEKSFIFVSTCIKNNNAIITIKDNGGGIPKDVIEHIFEAYFTTKHQSQGTGLGLNMTYNMIVNNIKGCVKASNTTYTYENKVYNGALFTIKIPLIYKEEKEV